MKVASLFPSKFLKSADLQGRSVIVTIDRVVMENIQSQEGTETKPCVYFKESERGMVLNQTNANMLAEDYGDDTDRWVGQKIELYPARVQFGAKMVDAIRCKAHFPPRSQNFAEGTQPRTHQPPQGGPPPQRFAGDPGPTGPESYGADPFGGPNDDIPFN